MNPNAQAAIKIFLALSLGIFVFTLLELYGILYLLNSLILGAIPIIHVPSTPSLSEILGFLSSLLKLFLLSICSFVNFGFAYYITVKVLIFFAKRSRKKAILKTYSFPDLERCPDAKGYRESNLLYLVALKFSQVLPQLHVETLRALGAKIGKNVHIYGTILEPDLVEIGDGSIIGYQALILGHGRTTKEFVIGPIKIGKNCVIGARAIILPNVEIKDGTMIAANAIVLSGTVTKENSLYAGVPAKFKKISRRGVPRRMSKPFNIQESQIFSIVSV